MFVYACLLSVLYFSVVALLTHCFIFVLEVNGNKPMNCLGYEIKHELENSRLDRHKSTLCRTKKMMTYHELYQLFTTKMNVVFEA